MVYSSSPYRNITGQASCIRYGVASRARYRDPGLRRRCVEKLPRLLRKKLQIPKAASHQPIHLMIDSTGLRISRWNGPQTAKAACMRKLHIAV